MQVNNSSIYDFIRRTSEKNTFPSNRKKSAKTPQSASKSNSGVTVEFSKKGLDKLKAGSLSAGIMATNNHIKLNDPIQDALSKNMVLLRVDEDGTEIWGDLASESEYATLDFINEDGVPQWTIKSGKEAEFDAEIEKALQKFGGRDSYNFWMRLTGEPTFMGLQYSADEVRNRLSAADIEKGFFDVTVANHSATQFRSNGKNAYAVYSKAKYDERYYKFIQSGGICRDYEPGEVFKIDGKEYTVNEDRKIDVPYGADIWDVEYPKR